MQQQGGSYKDIAYASMCFSSAQRSATIEHEVTAIRWGLQTFESFIYGVPFLLYTDHKPLVYFQNMSIHSSRLMRTLNELAELILRFVIVLVLTMKRLILCRA